MKVCRGLRGATKAECNTVEGIHGATREMLERLIEVNDIDEHDVAMAYFTRDAGPERRISGGSRTSAGLEQNGIDVRDGNSRARLLAELHSCAYTYQH